jgi:hypothetical protein
MGGAAARAQEFFQIANVGAFCFSQLCVQVSVQSLLELFLDGIRHEVLQLGFHEQGISATGEGEGYRINPLLYVFYNAQDEFRR